jgi:hypothetical protein
VSSRRRRIIQTIQMILPARQKAIRARGVGGSGVEVRVGRGAFSGRWFILWWARKWVGWWVGGRMGGSQLKWVTKMDGGSLSIKKVFCAFSNSDRSDPI